MSFEKILIICVIAAFILGPERIPVAAASLGRFVRSIKSFTDNAKNRVQSELGPEFGEIDWQKLDPRQYDPRRIVREALLGDGADEAAAVPAYAHTIEDPSDEATEPEPVYVHTLENALPEPEAAPVYAHTLGNALAEPEAAPADVARLETRASDTDREGAALRLPVP